MRSLKTIFIYLFILGITTAGKTQNVLDEYLKTASENNPSLKAAFSEYNAALQMLPQAKALPDPNIMFQYFTTPMLLEMGKQRFVFSASQLFPWFGQLKAQEQAAAEMAKAKYEEFIEKRNKLFYEVKSNYFKLYVHHKTVSKLEENISLLNSMRKLAEIKLESGNGNFANVLSTEMEIAEMENELVYQKDIELPMIVEFEKLLNTKKYSPLSFPDTLWQDSISEIKSAIMDSIAINNPELKKLDYEISYSERKMDVVKKMGNPSISIGGAYINMTKRTDMEFSGNGRDMWMFPEVGVMIPLYRKKYKAMTDEAKYKREYIAYEKINKTNELKSEMEMIYSDYLKAQREIILYTRLFSLAKNTQELLLSAYSVSGTDFEEILRMQERQLKYAVKLEEARAMLNTSVAYIKYLTGSEN